MDKNKKKAIEKNVQKRENEMFNSVTQKVKVENQNQSHNARKEGIGATPNNKF